MSEEILRKLDKVSEKLDVMLQWKSGFEQRCVSHNEKTQEVRTVLFDGPDCLLKRVDRLNHIKETESRQKDFWMSVAKVCVATFIISLAVWLFSLYRDSNQTVQIEKEKIITSTK